MKTAFNSSDDLIRTSAIYGSAISLERNRISVNKILYRMSHHEDRRYNPYIDFSVKTIHMYLKHVFPFQRNNYITTNKEMVFVEVKTVILLD